jgi:hypothetical protein
VLFHLLGHMQIMPHRATFATRPARAGHVRYTETVGNVRKEG